jgi:hypothetical protein
MGYLWRQRIALGESRAAGRGERDESLRIGPAGGSASACFDAEAKRYDTVAGKNAHTFSVRALFTFRIAGR